MFFLVETHACAIVREAVLVDLLDLEPDWQMYSMFRKRTGDRIFALSGSFALEKERLNSCIYGE